MRYYVYVIELSKKVFTESTRFRDANPQFNGVLQCLYVGMTSKTPAERLKQHKSWIHKQERPQAICQHRSEIRFLFTSESLRSYK